MSLCIINKARKKLPNKKAVILKDKSLSYLELDEIVQNVQEKIKKYRRICFIPDFSFESIILIFAAFRANVKLCLLSHRNPLDYNKKIEGIFKPDAFFYLSDQLKQLFKEPLKNECFSNSSNINDEPNLCVLTSGTSSIPKIACLSYKNFLSNAIVVCQKLNFNSQDTWILALPLFHVAGLSILFRVFSSCATLSLTQDKKYYNAEGNFISLVPTQLKQILDQPNFSPDKFKCVLVGGAQLNSSLFFKAQKLGLNLAISYGMTESASQILISKNPHYINGLYYLGFPDKHCKIYLDKKMQMSIKGASVFHNYYQDSEPVKLFKTQDILKFNKKYGYAFFARANEMFISGGENIFPEEIEREILKFKEVEEVYIIGIEDKDFGHVPVAFVLGENYSEDKIKTSLLKVLPKYKVPLRFFKIPLHFFNGMKCSRRELKKNLTFE